MALWTSMGHAMRRRMGAPTNHLESAGKSMERSHATHDETLASPEHANSPRRTMGMDATHFSSASGTPVRGTLVAKKNTQAGDPTAGGKANRKNILVDTSAASERHGARYSISVKFPEGTDPTAGPTMANSRIVPSVMGQNQNFSGGVSGAY